MAVPSRLPQPLRHSPGIIVCIVDLAFGSGSEVLVAFIVAVEVCTK
jgi:hypothetical protein